MSVGKGKNGSWYVQYRVLGESSPKKEYFGKGAAAKKEAQIRENEIKNLKLRGEFNVSSATDKYFIEVAQEYVDELRARRKSTAYIENMKRLINKDWQPMFKKKLIKNIQLTDFNPLRKKYMHLQPVTAGNYLGMLNSIFNYAEFMEYVSVNPMKKWLRKNKVKPTRRKLHLTFDDLAKLVQHAQPHLKFALQILWETGVRPGPSELFKLKWSDINWDDGEIYVRGTKTEGAARRIPLTEDFLARLREKQLEATTEYLIEYKGKPIKRKLDKSLAQAVNAAGIKYPVCLYQVRHLFTSELVRAKADTSAVASILGHSTLKMMAEVYCHELNGESRKAVNVKPKLPAL